MSGAQQTKLDLVIRGIFKALLLVGAGLESPKHQQNLFVDIVDKILTLLRERGLAREDVVALLDGIAACSSEPGPARTPCFDRLMRGLAPIVLRWFR